MKQLKLSYCPKEGKSCIGWIEKYFKDCLCNLNDEISFGFGIASLICWAVAEIPQIITNFNNKSADGVSLAFLCTWIVGDVFNLVGCILEPATLPTQLYTAWVSLTQTILQMTLHQMFSICVTLQLYTTVTIILALQSIYYNHFLRCLKRGRKTVAKVDEDETDAPKSKFQGRLTSSNVPVEVPHRRDFYYMSARSLAGSDSSPMNQCYIKARSGPPALEHDSDSSSEDESFLPSSNEPVIVTQPRNIPRPVGYGTFAAASVNLPFLTRALTDTGGRRSMMEQAFQENAYGQCLGWLMAAIYMGGRIPQIWLSIKRGSVEGLNPLMFVFALIANATYVGSILVRSTEWKMIKANMPWLMDAIGCVLLDLFIILQYMFYRYKKHKKSQHQEEANKPSC
ncbi:probable vacuolar amino acid transporter YPQ3 isoform X2 [Olea europaea var. sylvestris]|uniref:probable vacuolar amino acid transporter YPQ3 isoform X2 n=1 Tax=Olea europaea var. sylvestris TaxID=158386 RepID=UPI000C1D2B65|nr:probable vacuolar amino acid transporter YPQ3 isoform X2 [Olea europaea var. sylvestris]